MKQRLEELARDKKNISVSFAAAAGGKLVSINGSIASVGDDFMTMTDIYGNTMIVPFASIVFIEIKK